VESSYILCWAAKWYGQSRVYFESAEKQSRQAVLKPIHRMLDEADFVVHFNGVSFDIPILNREFIKHGFGPPSPYKQIDLKRVAKRAFRFESNKLAYITKALGLHSKDARQDFQLWVDCMDGKREAWRKMERYNRNDVAIMEPLYERLRPWIAQHPNVSAFLEGLACPKCGSKKTQQRGVQVAVSKIYQRHHCQNCGGWFRSNKSLLVENTERGVNIAC
jgi:uncharacterized protein YprB with RNaseH-like and TPR domain